MPKSDPFWWDDAGPPVRLAERALPNEADVVVVGAGLTGLSAARTLARAGKAVVVLDAEAPGHGASSRNGGMIGGGHRLSIDQMEILYGADTALGLLREAHLTSAIFARELMRDEGIDCDYQEVGRFRGLWHRSEYDAEGRALARLQRLIPLEAHLVSKARQHEEIVTDLYEGGVVYPRHAGLNPAKWVAGLLAAAQRCGAIVHGATAVTGYRRENGAFRVETSRGALRAGQILMATNGYTSPRQVRTARRIVPIPSYMMTTERLGHDLVHSLMPKGRMVAESRERHCYYRPSPDGQRIVFGGRAAMFEAPEWFACAQLKRLLRQIFPALGDIRPSHVWRGRTGFTFSSLPHVGQLDGVWHAIGYSGSGNAMAPYLGHKAALQMIGDPDGETAFSRTAFPTRWWHPGVAWFLPFADVTFRVRDGWNTLRRAR